MPGYGWIVGARRAVALASVVLLASSALVEAQVRRQGPGDRGQREAELMRMIEARFAAQVQSELLLSDEQMVRVRRVLSASAERLRGLGVQDRALQQALREQLRPGVAAQTDSVTRLLDRLGAVRIEVAQVARDEIRDLGAVLTPVQQAQYVLLRDRLRMRALELRMQRNPMLPPGGQ
jgi:hypothetical protein